MSAFIWVISLVIGAAAFYQIFGLDEAMGSAAADHVDFNIKVQEVDPYEPKEHH